MPALTAGEKTLLRAEGHKAKFYLSISQPRTLLTAQVNSGSLNRGDQSIPYDNGSGPNFSDIEEGHTMRVVTATGVKKIRVQSVSGTASSGTLTVDKNAVVWADNQDFTIIEEYRLYPLPPRFDANGVFYKNWSITYSNQNSQPPPIEISGGHRVGFLVSGSIVFNIDLSDSYPIADGATISSYSLSVTPSAGVSISFNTSTGIGTVTIASAGQYWMHSSCTDSNGQSQERRDRLVAHDPDPDNSDYPYTDFNINTYNGDWERGGWVLGIDVNGVADTGAFPEEALVILWYQVDYGGTAQYIGGVSDKNILFAGYILSATARADWERGVVSFEAQTIDGLLRAIKMRQLTLQAVDSPSKWYEYANWLTLGRGLHHLWKWHSTLLTIADVRGLTDNTLGRKFFDLPEGNLYSGADSIIRQNGVFAHIVCNKAGQIRIVQDLQYRNDADRAAAVVVSDITASDRRNEISVTEQQETASEATVDGLVYDGATDTVTPLLAKAPGDVFEPAGAGVVNVPGQVLADQASANDLVGRVLAIANNRYPRVQISPHGIYIGALEIADPEWWQMSLASGDTTRQIVWTDKKLLLRQVNSGIGTANGTIFSDCAFDTEADGVVGVTDTFPGPPGCKPGQGSNGINNPTPGDEALDEEARPPEVLSVFSSTEVSKQQIDVDNAWSQLATDTGIEYGDFDPYWPQKAQSYDPAGIQYSYVGSGLIKDVGGFEQTPVSNLPSSAPPNTWSDATAPTVNNVDYLVEKYDLFNKNVRYILVRYEHSGSWRGWLLKRTGAVDSYLALYDQITLPSQSKPIWLAVTCNHVLVTVWQDLATDKLKLIVFTKSPFAYDSEYDLGNTSEAELDAFAKFAFPVATPDFSANSPDATAPFIVAGIMVNPVGETGTFYALEYDGAAWTEIEVKDEDGEDEEMYTDWISSLIAGPADTANGREYWAFRQGVD